MQITEVKVFPINEDKLKAFVSVVFDGCFMVNDIKVIRGREGLFISMPSRKKKSGEFKDVAHPLNNETRRMIETQVLAEYERVLVDRGEQPEAPVPRIAAPPPARPAPSPAPEAAHREPPVDAAAPAAVAASAGDPVAPAQAESDDEEGEKSLKEIEELHLRDSFWSMG